METFTKLQVSMSFVEALDQIPMYAKFTKELMKIKRKPVDDENVVLTEECSAIIQRKLPTKLNGPDRFIIPCTIRNLEVMN